VIATGASGQQVRAIAEEVERVLREDAAVKPRGREGLDLREWVLLDYGDFVVHVFQPDIRDFYRLETLWRDAPQLELPEHVAAPAAKSSEDAT
jgi:ribosome-associated protein